mgnify:CR=1 FL=1
MPKETNKKQEVKKQDSKKQDSKNKRHFMKDFKAELKRVIWPTPKQLLNNTVAVITVVLITAAIVFVLDFVFESMNKYGIVKLKEIVDTTNTIDGNSVDNIDTNNPDSNTVVANEVPDNESNEVENTVSEDANSVEE